MNDLNEKYSGLYMFKVLLNTLKKYNIENNIIRLVLVYLLFIR
jgi:hypothetical protein